MPPTEGPADAEVLAPRYSVIVPARNCAHTLDECLTALLQQSVAREGYEIIVVDDGSTDDSADVAARYEVRVLRQAHQGPASARNRGARAARGEMLLFTDADCVPTPDWLAAITRPLEADPSVAASKGSYATRQRGLLALFAQVELEEKYAHLASRQRIDFLDTYSAAIRREDFWACGGFDPSFTQASNEDTLLAFNLAAAGRPIVFAPRAVVYHRHAESLGHYLRRKWRHGYWRVPVYRHHPGKMAGDSYTPHSTQVQLLLTPLLLGLAPWRRTRRLWWLAVGAYGWASWPFVRRAWPVSRRLAVLVPWLLLARAVALGAGLAAGALGLGLRGLRRPAQGS